MPICAVLKERLIAREKKILDRTLGVYVPCALFFPERPLFEHDHSTELELWALGDDEPYNYRGAVKCAARVLAGWRSADVTDSERWEALFDYATRPEEVRHADSRRAT